MGGIAQVTRALDRLSLHPFFAEADGLSLLAAARRVAVFERTGPDVGAWTATTERAASLVQNHRRSTMGFLAGSAAIAEPGHRRRLERVIIAEDSDAWRAYGLLEMIEFGNPMAVDEFVGFVESSPSMRPSQIGEAALEQYNRSAAFVEPGIGHVTFATGGDELLRVLEHRPSRSFEVAAQQLGIKMDTGSGPTQSQMQRSLSTTVHEMEHLRSQRVTIPGHLWLDEGATELITRWPGYLDEAAVTLGQPYIHTRWGTSLAYNGFVGSVRHLLRLAGVDTMLPTQRANAERILHQPSTAHVINVLADRIGEQHRLTPAQIPRLARMIDKFNGRPEQVRGFEKSIARMQRKR